MTKRFFPFFAAQQRDEPFLLHHVKGRLEEDGATCKLVKLVKCLPTISMDDRRGILFTSIPVKIVQ
jgi:hypothetical protein